MTRTAALISVVALLLAVMVAKGLRGQSTAGVQPAANADAVTSIHMPRLLCLGSSTEGTIDAMRPILAALRRECAGRLRVQQLDVAFDDQARSIFGVRSLPVLVFYDANGREVLRHEGAMSRDDIVKAWEGMGIMLQGRGSSAEGNVLPGPPR